MLHLNIRPLCAGRDIRKPFAFLTRNGFTHSTAKFICSGHYAQPKLAHIERLCILLKCTPIDILEWQPDEDQARADLPLTALIPKKEATFEWMKEVRNLPLDKLRALQAVVKSELEK